MSCMSQALERWRGAVFRPSTTSRSFRHCTHSALLAPLASLPACVRGSQEERYQWWELEVLALSSDADREREGGEGALIIISVQTASRYGI